MQLTFFTNIRWLSSTSIFNRTVKPGGYNKSKLPLIKKKDYEILYGLILGDLYISRKNSENALLKFEQSTVNKDYLKHLFNIFSYLCTESTVVRTKDVKITNTSAVYFVTRQLAAITELHTLFYPKGIKVVPHNIGSLITAKSLAYWAMDDGERHKSGFILNTCGFSLNDIQLLQAALKDNWDIDSSIHSRNRLYINSSSKSKFIELVKPHFYSTMLYKLN